MARVRLSLTELETTGTHRDAAEFKVRCKTGALVEIEMIAAKRN